MDNKNEIHKHNLNPPGLTHHLHEHLYISKPNDITDIASTISGSLGNQIDRSKIPQVRLADYKISQGTRGIDESLKSTIILEIDVICSDTGPNKHANLINELKSFLEERNDRLRQT